MVDGRHNKHRHNSATVWTIAIKFCTMSYGATLQPLIS